MQEFICPNGRMSVNGVCPIFEGDDGQVKDFNKPKEKNFFQFDFEKATENAFEKADNIISKNIRAYNSFVENNLGIPSTVQNVARVGSAISGFGSYGVVGAIAPFAIPFITGAALDNRAEQQAAQQQNFVDAAAAKRNIQQYTSGGGGGNQSSPARTSQGVTSAQHAAFRS